MIKELGHRDNRDAQRLLQTNITERPPEERVTRVWGHALKQCDSMSFAVPIIQHVGGRGLWEPDSGYR